MERESDPDQPIDPPNGCQRQPDEPMAVCVRVVGPGMAAVVPTTIDGGEDRSRSEVGTRSGGGPQADVVVRLTALPSGSVTWATRWPQGMSLAGAGA